MIRKVVLLEISRNSLLTGVAGLHPTGCNATKSQLLIKLFKGVLNVFRKSPEKAL